MRVSGSAVHAQFIVAGLAFDEDQGHIVGDLVPDVVGQLVEQAVEGVVETSRAQRGGMLCEREERPSRSRVSTSPSV